MGAFWTTLAATLAGGLISVVTALLTAWYNLQQLKAQEDRADARDELNYQREQLQKSEQMRTEPIAQEIVALEAFSRGASRFYLLTETLEAQNPEVVAAKIEFAKLAGAAYRYWKLAPFVEAFKDYPESSEFQNLMKAVEEIISERRTELLEGRVLPQPEHVVVIKERGGSAESPSNSSSAAEAPADGSVVRMARWLERRLRGGKDE